MIYTKGNWSLTELESLPRPQTPRAGAYWRPLAHHTLVKTLTKQCEERRWTLSNPVVSVSPSGSDMTASFDLGVPDLAVFVRDVLGCLWPGGVSLSLGVLNSNSQEYSLRLFGGLALKPEGLGVVFREFKLGRHTSVNSPNVGDRLDSGLTRLSASFLDFHNDPARLTATQLTPAELNQILVQAARDRLLPWSRVGRVDKLFRGKGEGGAGKKSAWDLVTSFSKVVRMNNPLVQMHQSLKFYQLVVGVCR